VKAVKSYSTNRTDRQTDETQRITRPYLQMVWRTAVLSMAFDYLVVFISHLWHRC